VSSEWDCFLQAQQGDELAWRVLIEQYQTRLAALALLITGSTAAADDIVQETFVRALGAKIRDRSGTVRGFLGTIAYRLALKESKRQRRNVEFDGLNLPDRNEGPLESVLKDERDRLVTDAIGKLDTEHRDVLVLRFYGGYGYDEIAELVKAPLGTVKSRIFYAVKSCREILRQKGVLDDTH
jgi:RNA polymerase sigma-70 factor (ECF subfamily)